MRKNNFHTSVVRFKRFSRKNYAAFLSLKKVVNIGSVANYIADLQLKKSHRENFISSSNSQNFSFSENQEEEQDLSLNFLLQEISAQILPSKTCANAVNHCLKHSFFSFSELGRIFFQARFVSDTNQNFFTMTKKVFLPAILVGGWISAFSQNSQTLDYQLDEVQILHQKATLASENLRLIQTLSKAEIQTLPAQTLGELLDFLPGVDVRTRGVGGAQADLSLRGSGYDQVQILINGVNFTDPQTGHFNLDLPLDLSQIERIELLQGTTQGLFGLAAFGGAINIITTSKNSKNAVKTEIAGGSFSNFSSNLGVNFSKKNWQISASAAHNQSTGYIANTDFRNSNAFLQALCADSLTGDWHLQLGTQIKAYGANAFYSLAYPDQFEATNSLLTSLSWEKRFARFSLHSSAFYRTHYDEFQLFRDGVSLPAWYKNHNHHITHTAGGNFKAFIFENFGKTAFGVELRNENIVSNVLGDSLSAPLPLPIFARKENSPEFIFGKNRLNINYFAEQSFFVKNFSASLGLSGNYNTMFNHNFALGANFGYQILKNFNARLGLNRALRLPTFTDLYYKSATQISNPNLKPETAYTLDGSLQGRFGDFRFCANGFYRLGLNIIDWVKTPAETLWRSANHTRIDASGAEILLGYSYGFWLKNLELSYSFCNVSQNSGELLSKYVLDYLRHKINLRLEHAIYRNFGATWQLAVHSRAGNFLDRDGVLQTYNPFALLDARLFYKTDRYNIFAEVSNLTSTRYHDYGGIPQPPAWLRVGINFYLDF